jgi:predicted metal-dependent RNase
MSIVHQCFAVVFGSRVHEAHSKCNHCGVFPTLQIYSALSYGGPHLIGQIKRDLAALLHADGYSRVSDAVGAEFKKGR